MADTNTNEQGGNGKDIGGVCLTRRFDESVFIGDDIKIKVIGIGRGKVKLFIQAPKDVVILREELVGKPKV